jgi:ABC-type uncharacterized transport system ATPase subunit
MAAALLGDPRVVVLDEPVNGLDPEGVLWVRNLLKGLAAEGHTVFVSSHLMSEMALTAARLVVIGRGRLIADTTVGEFVAVFFVIPLLATLLPASISNHLAQYLPSNAGDAIWGGAALVPNALSPWTGFALLCGYAAILIGAGAWRLRRSDA